MPNPMHWVIAIGMIALSLWLMSGSSNKNTKDTAKCALLLPGCIVLGCLILIALLK